MGKSGGVQSTTTPAPTLSPQAESLQNYLFGALDSNITNPTNQTNSATATQNLMPQSFGSINTNASIPTASQAALAQQIANQPSPSMAGYMPSFLSGMQGPQSFNPLMGSGAPPPNTSPIAPGSPGAGFLGALGLGGGGASAPPPGGMIMSPGAQAQGTPQSVAAPSTQGKTG
jgi:hypothetical protein